MNKWIGILLCVLLVQQICAQKNVAVYKIAVQGEVTHKNLAFGFQYSPLNRIYLPLSIGVGKEFNEKKWNDWFVVLKPYYLLGERRIQFPVGVLFGLRQLKDHTHHFPVFYGGVYTGMTYRMQRHQVGLDVGAKFGKDRHILNSRESYGTIEASEWYKEQTLFYSLRYLYYF